MSVSLRRQLRKPTTLLAALALCATSLASVVTAGAAHAATSHPSKGTLRVCVTSNKTHAVTFAVTGRATARTIHLRAVAKRQVCSAALKLAPGKYNVRQSAQKNMLVTSVSVLPKTWARLASASSRLAQVTVKAGHATTVRFRNFVATPTQPADPGTGYVEVCKYAGDSWVTGSVGVTVTSGTFSTSQIVPVGECTGPIQVPAGQATVTETVASPYALSSVTVNPASALVSTDLANSKAVVTVTKGDVSSETLVNLTNSTRVAFFKVCKLLDANAGDLIAKGANTFAFDASYAFGSVTGSLPVLHVTVPELQKTVCVIEPLALPLGTKVSITEEQVPNTTLTGISVQPASQDAGSTATTANLTVGPNANGVTAATFTNRADGTIEICKVIDDSNWRRGWQDRSIGTSSMGMGSPYNGTAFQFTINGVKTITVRAGSCSAPISVPAGTATIEELSTDNFSLVGFTAVGPDGKSRVVTDGNPVTVSVPWGGLSNRGVGNETLVTATNQVNVGMVKVCKQVSDAKLVGKTYQFETKFNVGPLWFQQDVSLTPTDVGQDGMVCGYLSAPMPVIQPNGDPISFTTTEGATGGPYTSDGKLISAVTAVEYAGNGQLTDSKVWTPNDTQSDDGTYFGTADIGQGVNALIFTNSIVDP